MGIDIIIVGDWFSIIGVGFMDTYLFRDLYDPYTLLHTVDGEHWEVMDLASDFMYESGRELRVDRVGAPDTEHYFFSFERENIRRFGEFE